LLPRFDRRDAAVLFGVEISSTIGLIDADRDKACRCDPQRERLFVLGAPDRCLPRCRDLLKRFGAKQLGRCSFGGWR
jgi:hypothetical protein